MDYKIHMEVRGVIGIALTDRAEKVYGKGEVLVDIPPDEFLLNFPPNWVLGVVDNNGKLYLMTNNSLH